jgi:riboflavin synthase
MFTGLIKDVGEITRVDDHGVDRVFTLATKLDLKGQQIGASIACNGVCLTLTEKTANSFMAMASAETLSKTTLGEWKAGRKINLEPSLRLGDEMGGHFVFGHVDASVTLQGKTSDGQSWRLQFELPPMAKAFIAPKGSVALDGVSLTVNEVTDGSFGVNIIPHTLQNTNFASLEPGQRVNLEIDMLARYVARMNESRAA